MSPSCARSAPRSWSAAGPRSTPPWARSPRPDESDHRGPLQGHPQGLLPLSEDGGVPSGSAKPVIVEVERGRDLGRVTAVGDVAAKKCGGGCTGCAVGGDAEPEAAPLKPVLRRATRGRHPGARREPRWTRRTCAARCIERVRAHSLVMKVSDTEWQWDRNKLTIYFTAEKRVDFRALVRDLASLVPHPHRAAADRRARRGGPALRRGPLRAGVLLLAPGSRSSRRSTSASPRTSTCRSIPARSPAAAAACSAASSTSTSSTSPPASASPRRARRCAPAAGAERVVAVDIFRERVFLRSEEHGLPDHPAGSAARGGRGPGRSACPPAERAPAGRESRPEARDRGRGTPSDPSAPTGQLRPPAAARGSGRCTPPARVRRRTTAADAALLLPEERGRLSATSREGPARSDQLSALRARAES